MKELLDLSIVYSEIVKSVIKEVARYLEGKKIKIIIDNNEIEVTFKKLNIEDIDVGD